MKTRILNPSIETFALAKSLISNDELVAFPTETVYGLGANALSDSAVKKIFLTKGRDQDNPLILHFANKNDIENVAIIQNDIEKKLIEKCMPGPISIVLDKKKGMCKQATCGLDTVACRIPANKVARDFIAAMGAPICAPSANLSKRPSPTTAQDVLEDMNGKINLIIDGGACEIGIESTVVRVIEDTVYILRPGKYTAEELIKITGVPVVENVKTEGAPISPGTKYAHYCPKAEMIMVMHDVITQINRIYETKIQEGKNPIILCSQQLENNFKDKPHLVLGIDNIQACENLFHLLRQAEKNYDVIIAQFIQEGNMGAGLYNRMSKAASGKII